MILILKIEWILKKFQTFIIKKKNLKKKDCHVLEKAILSIGDMTEHESFVKFVVMFSFTQRIFVVVNL